MRVHDGVNAQLQGRGLMRVEANPDLYVATSTLSSKPSKNTAKLDKALTKMFERYPPGITSANN